MLSVYTHTYCAYDAVLGRHCRDSRRSLHCPLMIATWTSAPFFSRHSRWVIHVIHVAWHRNTPFVGSLLVKLHATDTLQAVP